MSKLNKHQGIKFTFVALIVLILSITVAYAQDLSSVGDANADTGVEEASLEESEVLSTDEGEVIDTDDGSEVVTADDSQDSVKFLSDFSSDKNSEEPSADTEEVFDKYDIRYILANYNAFVADDYKGYVKDRANHIVGPVIVGGDINSSGLGGFSAGSIPPEKYAGIYRTFKTNVPIYFGGNIQAPFNYSFQEGGKAFINRPSDPIRIDYISGGTDTNPITSSVSSNTDGDEYIKFIDYKYVDFDKAKEAFGTQMKKINSVADSTINLNEISTWFKTHSDNYIGNGFVVKKDGNTQFDFILDTKNSKNIYKIEGMFDKVKEHGKDYVELDGHRVIFNIMGKKEDSVIFITDETEVNIPSIYIDGETPGSIEYDTKNPSITFMAPNATSVFTEEGHTGHIVAPIAHIDIPGGNYNGCLIADSVRTSAEGHMWPFRYQKLSVNVDVTKKWNVEEGVDVVLPDSVGVVVVGRNNNGVDVVKHTLTITGENDWKASLELEPFDDNGNKLTYSVEERNVPEGWELESIVPDSGYTFVVTNKHKEKKTKFNLPIQKIIVDRVTGNHKAGEGITFMLHKGNELIDTKSVELSTIEFGDGLQDYELGNGTLTDGAWCEFSDLDINTVYTIKEDIGNNTDFLNEAREFSFYFNDDGKLVLDGASDDYGIAYDKESESNTDYVKVYNYIEDIPAPTGVDSSGDVFGTMLYTVSGLFGFMCTRLLKI